MAAAKEIAVGEGSQGEGYGSGSSTRPRCREASFQLQNAGGTGPTGPMLAFSQPRVGQAKVHTRGHPDDDVGVRERKMHRARRGKRAPDQHRCEMAGNLWVRLITGECSSSDSGPSKVLSFSPAIVPILIPLLPPLSAGI